jgi:Domain of unknown function (DUF4232)
VDVSQRGSGRQRRAAIIWRVRVPLAALAVVGLLAGGCGGRRAASQHPSAVVPLVAWSDAAVPGLRAPAGRPARPCRASDLRVQGKGFVFAAAPEGAVGSVELRNAGAAACRLTGRPRVRFVGAPREPQQRQAQLPATQPQFPQVLRPAASLLALQPGDAATLTVDWRNWCVPGARRAKGPLVPPRAVRITLPGARGSLDVTYNAVAPCEEPAAPSTIGVRPFQPAGLAPTDPWTRLAVSARALTLAGGPGPLHAVRGGVLEYSVLLRNESRGTLRFSRCPLVAEMLAPDGAIEAHPLNCARAHPVRPGEAIRFEMRLRVPQTAPLGVNGLFWDLDPLGAQGPEAVARVVVGKP